MNKYGKFSEDYMEFIIHRPDTPAPWVNYISNGKYTGLVSHTGGGFSFYGSPRDNRITRWRYNSLPADRPGRYILLRDKLSGDVWSATWQPVPENYDEYECRHGLYYTRISLGYKKIRSEVLYFVGKENLEIWKIKLTNDREKPVVLDSFAFTELALGHALVDLINQPNDQHFNDVFFDKKQQILFASKRYWVTYSGPTVQQSNKEWDKFVFFTSNLPVISFDGSKNKFIGKWRSESNPAAVENGKCFNTEITAGDAIAALQNEIKLQPGESTEYVILLGIVPKHDFKTHALNMVNKYRDISYVNKEFSDQKNSWKKYLSHVNIETPDEDMNRMINVWNQYQTSVTFRFSRDASYYHGGLLFGRGFRDSCQDILGPVMARPDWVRQRILEMATKQFKDGSTYHLYYPQSGGGEKTGHSDTPLWLPFAITTYLKESGDFEILKEIIPFEDGGTASLLEHACSAVNYTISNLSERYLAKFGPGDWNDTLDYLGRKGKGESIWVTMFLAFILKEMTELAEYLDLNDIRLKYQDEYKKICAALNRFCWDGSWYIRGTTDEGQVIGSNMNTEGKIFLNTQSWAVISGIAPPDRALACMDSAAEHLDTPKGPKILHPAYTKIDETIGLATRCVPGKKENGAVFNHPVSWAILAECLLGRADKAFEIYKKALPMNPAVDIDRYEVEPYVYAEYVTSPDHDLMGQASHSWLTGSSAWMLRDATDYILGFQPVYEGIRIKPCVSPSWKTFKMHRIYRGFEFDIIYSNKLENKSTGFELYLNGLKMKSSILDLESLKKTGQLSGNKINLIEIICT